MPLLVIVTRKTVKLLYDGYWVQLACLAVAYLYRLILYVSLVPFSSCECEEVEMYML